MNLLQHIAQSRHLLRKSELKVADHVLLDPAAVMHSSMADLAHSVGISEPTIVRFCRAIGCSGFQDLKLKLAQSLAAGASFGQFAWKKCVCVVFIPKLKRDSCRVDVPF